MSRTDQVHGYRVYWIVWFVLLIVTVGMMLLGTAGLTTFLILILLLGMLLKESLIGGYFMHLRFERANLILIVAVGILATAGVLFFLIAPDGLRVLHSGSHVDFGGGR
jgi:cytochrome c oxidase subunit IV